MYEYKKCKAFDIQNIILKYSSDQKLKKNKIFQMQSVWKIYIIVKMSSWYQKIDLYINKQDFVIHEYDLTYWNWFF